MTLPSTLPAHSPVEEPGASTPDAPRRRVPRLAVFLAGVLVLVGAAAALTFLRPSGPSTAALHPANPGFNGAQAVARVLQAKGIDVVVAEGEPALRRAAIDSDTTILVSNTADLRDATVTSFISVARPAERVVLVVPERRIVRQLAPLVGMRIEQRSAPALTGQCSGPDVRQGEQLSRSTWEYLAPQTGSVRAQSCYVTADRFAVYLRTSTPQLRDLVLIGSADVLSNDRVDELDNAALALRALGHSGRVVWYVPDVRDVPPTQVTSVEAFEPPWWRPMLVLLTFAFAALVWWKARRLGRLVLEPLPVVVRAVETTESRGRMYRKARDTGRAAAVLRDATMRRLTAYLGLPAGSDPDTLAASVAAASGRPVEQVRELLDGEVPPTDPALLDLAVSLAALEKEIRRS